MRPTSFRGLHGTCRQPLSCHPFPFAIHTLSSRFPSVHEKKQILQSDSQIGGIPETIAEVLLSKKKGGKLYPAQLQGFNMLCRLGTSVLSCRGVFKTNL